MKIKYNGFGLDKCLVGQKEGWTNVCFIIWLDKCQVGQMSGWTIVWVGQMSCWTNVWLDKCLVGQTSWLNKHRLDKRRTTYGSGYKFTREAEEQP